MNHREIIRTTFAAAEPAGDAISLEFYRRLFQLAPETRALFSEDMQDQRRKLIQTLSVIVGQLESHVALDKQLVNLGRRHHAYGAKPEHYQAVRSALIGALAAQFGAAFTGEVAEAWNLAYDVIEAKMLEGQEQAERAAVKCQQA